MEKTCSKCGETKATTDFYIRRASYDGLYSHCIECQRTKAKKYREKNKSRLKKEKRQWQIENRDRINHRARERYQEDKEQFRNKIDRWRNKNPVKAKRSDLIARQNHKKKVGYGYCNALIRHYTDLNANDIPPELVELKRQEILLMRKLKNLQNE